MQAYAARTRLFFALSFTFASFGCGREPGGPASLDETNRVRAASAAELSEQKVLAASYLVAFRPRQGEAQQRFQGFAGEQSAHLAYLDAGYVGDPRVKQLRFLSAVDLRPSTGAPKPTSPLGMPGYLQNLAPEHISADAMLGSLAQVDFASAEAAAAALSEWDEAGSLWFAEPNYVSHLHATPPAGTPVNLFATYADKYRGLAYWWVDRIGLPTAFNSIAARDLSLPNTPTDADFGNHRPIIAVFDSGIDYLHPGLIKHIWTNTDPNVSGCKDDLHGCNTTIASRDQLGNGDVWPYDADGPGASCLGRDANCEHGTHVAGILAGDSDWAESLSGSVAAGICPVCQLMVLRIVSKVGTDSGILDSSIVAAFKYISLFRRGGQPAVRVVNASFGKFARSRAVSLLLQSVKENDGTMVVAAAGNEDSQTPEYPAAFHDAVAVAAIDNDLRKLPFSNFGTWVSVSAPGDSILSTVPGGTLDIKSGTSMAAPMVAGLAGLLLARYPQMPFSDLRGAILGSADPSFYLPTVAGGFNYRNYFASVEGEAERIPLLGRGVVSASGAVNGTIVADQPAAASNNRVKPGCGIVAAAAPRPVSLWLLLAPLLLLL